MYNTIWKSTLTPERFDYDVDIVYEPDIVKENGNIEVKVQDLLESVVSFSLVEPNPEQLVLINEYTDFFEVSTSSTNSCKTLT